MDPMKDSSAGHSTSRWTIGRASALARVTLCASLAWIAACGSDSTTSPGGGGNPNSPIGSYNISTVNGKSLPVSLYAAGTYTYEVTAGTIGLTSDGKYSMINTYRQTIPGDVEIFADTTGGTWSLSGTTITMTDAADGSTGSVTWSANQLMFAIVDGKVTNTYVYAKK